MPSPRIAVIHAHPGMPPSRINSRMCEAARRLPQVTLRDLYEDYPDFDIDVEREQALLAESDLVVLHYPIRWYGMPALLKEWIDCVLTQGWAHGKGGNALLEKDCLIAVTSGSDATSYSAEGVHGFPFDSFLPPVIQTVRLCGMHWLPPFILHGAHQADEAMIAAHVARFVDWLSAYPTSAGR